MSKALTIERSPLETALRQATPKIAALLPRSFRMDGERMVRLAFVACQRNPQLLACSPESIIGGVVQAAQLGLEIGGVAGHAYLVPMKNRGQLQAQMVPGYRGLVQLVWRAAEIEVTARAVYQGDTFKVVLGTEQRIEHEPELYDPGEAIAYYAVATLPDKRVKFEVMSKQQTDAIMGRSQAAKSGFSPWSTDYDEMAKKTVAKRLCKWLPLASSEVAKAIEIDDRASTGIITPVGDVIDIPAEPAPEPNEQIDKVRARGRKKNPPMTDDEKAELEAREEREAIQQEGS
jgi:recombination protein RecT